MMRCLVLLLSLGLDAVLSSLDGASLLTAQVVHFSEESFDKGTFFQLPLLQARQECLDSLTARLERMNDASNLTPTQLEKLRVAGQVDIHRFFADYQSFKGGIYFGNIPRDQWQKLSVESRAAAKPFGRRFLEGLHQDGSLFVRLLHQTANPDQLASIAASERDAELEKFSQQIDDALLVVGRQVPLTVERRAEIKKLLLANAEPPPLFGTHISLYFVLARMGQIEEELRSMFNEKDWLAVKTLISAGKVWTK